MVKVIGILIFLFFYQNVFSQLVRGFDVVMSNPNGLSLPIHQYAVNPQNDSIIVASLSHNYFARSKDAGKTWEMHLGFAPTDFACISSDSLFAVHEDRVYFSTNLGETWSEIYQYLDPVNEVNLYSITHAGNGYLYAGGNNGCILRSVNYGVDWEVMKEVTFGYNHIVNFYFTDTINGFAMGGSGGNSNRRLLKTSDGFQTETQIPSPGSSNFQGLDINNRGFIHFLDSDLGIMGFGYHFFRTINGGETWMRITSMNSSSTVGKYNTCIAYGDSILLFRRNSIVYTTDVMSGFQQVQGNISSQVGGPNLTFSTIIPRKENAIYSYNTGYLFNYSIPDNSFDGLNPYMDVLGNNNNVGVGMIHFKNNEEGIASGPFFPIGGESSTNLWKNYAVSNNGGVSWDFDAHEGDFAPHPERDYHFIDSMNGVLQRELTTNNLSPLLITNDGGYSWINPETFNTNPDISFINNNGHGVHMMNKDTIYIVCNNSLLLTKNRGLEWEELTSDLPFRSRGIHFWSDNDGMLVGEDGVFYTNTGGETWEKVLEGNFHTISGFGASGAVIGGVYEFAITHDFGLTFDVKDIIEDYQMLNRFYASHMLNDQCGVISSDKLSFITYDGWNTYYEVFQPFTSGTASAVQMLADSSVVLGARHALMKINPIIEQPLFDVDFQDNEGLIYCSDEFVDLKFYFEGYEELDLSIELFFTNNSDTLFQDSLVVYNEANYSINLDQFEFEQEDTLFTLSFYPLEHGIEPIHFDLSIYKRPMPPEIITLNDTLFSIDGVAVDWVLDGVQLVELNTEYYNPVVNGSYSAIKKSQSYCPSDTSNIIEFLTLDIQGLESNSSLYTVYPNPTSDILRIDSEKALDATILLISTDGKILLEQKNNHLKSKNTILDLSKYSKGVYQLVIQQGGEIYRTSIIKH